VTHQLVAGSKNSSSSRISQAIEDEGEQGSRVVPWEGEGGGGGAPEFGRHRRLERHGAPRSGCRRGSEQGQSSTRGPRREVPPRGHNSERRGGEAGKRGQGRCAHEEDGGATYLTHGSNSGARCCRSNPSRTAAAGGGGRREPMLRLNFRANNIVSLLHLNTKKLRQPWYNGS